MFVCLLLFLALTFRLVIGVTSNHKSNHSNPKLLALTSLSCLNFPQNSAQVQGNLDNENSVSLFKHKITGTPVILSFFFFYVQIKTGNMLFFPLKKERQACNPPMKTVRELNMQRVINLCRLVLQERGKATVQ